MLNNFLNLQEKKMKTTLKYLTHFLPIGLVAVIMCNHAMATDTRSYQVTDAPVKEISWYEPTPQHHITVKTTNETIIVLQQSYRSEDRLTIVPANSEKQIDYMAFSECFRFIDEAHQVSKQCFNP